MSPGEFDFPLNPGNDVTPQLLWSGLVLLNERQERISVSLGEHRKEFTEGMGDVTRRLARVESRVTSIETTTLTPDQHAHVVDSLRRHQERSHSRQEIYTHVLKQTAAVIALLLLGILLAHTGFGQLPHIGG